MKRFLAVLFLLVPLMGFSQQPNQVMAFSDGRMATPTNLFKTNIYSGTNIYAESYGSKGEVRINVVGSLGGNSSILINGISKTNANFNATAPGVGLVGSAPVLWNVSGTNVTGYIYPASKNDPGVLPAGTGNSFKIPKTDIDGNWTLSDPGGGVTAIDNLTNASHFFVLLTNNVPGPYVTTNSTDTTILYLPYASWTNVGLLTSNNWQTFSDKADSNYVETLSGTNGMFVRTEIVSYSNTVNTRLSSLLQSATNYTDNHSNFIVATFGDVIVSNTITTGTNEAGMVVLNGPFSTPVRSDYLTNKTLTLDVTTNCTHELTTNSHFGVAFGGTPSAGAILVLAVSNSSPSSVINMTNPATVMTKYPVVGIPPGQWTMFSWQWEGNFWWFTGDPFATNAPTAGQILYSDGTARYWSNAPLTDWGVYSTNMVSNTASNILAFAQPIIVRTNLADAASATIYLDRDSIVQFTNAISQAVIVLLDVPADGKLFQVRAVSSGTQTLSFGGRAGIGVSWLNTNFNTGTGMTNLAIPSGKIALVSGQVWVGPGGTTNIDLGGVVQP